MAVNPKSALLIGGALYSCGVAWMVNNYYNQSSLKKIFVKTDKAYENVKIMHHA